MAKDDLILSLDENILLQLGDNADGTEVLSDNSQSEQDFILEEGYQLTLDDDGEDTDTLVDDVPHAQHYEDYPGPYIVTPVLYDEQELFTNDKHMTDNVTVKEIPVTRTTNPSGGITVVIG